MEKQYLVCCVCGISAGKWYQHHNRDNGYGICTRCAAEEMAELPAADFKRVYGEAGVNFEQPTVCYNGYRYKVLAASKSVAIANQFMERRKNSSVLTVLNNRLTVIVANDNLGEPLEEAV